MKKIILLPIFAVLISVLSFSAHDVYAVSFDIRDQPSCLALTSGSPSWNSSAKTCQITGASLAIHPKDSLILRFGTTLLITGGNITNGGIIVNHHGKITNFGSIHSFIGSTVTNDGGTIINNGIITNGGTMINNGTMTNSGTIKNYNNGTMSLLKDLGNTKTGTIINGGTIIIYNGLINSGGIIINNGEITNSNALANRGILINHGVINSWNNLINDAGGILVSTGSIINHPNGFIWNNDGATLFNSGFISNPEMSTFLNFNTLNNGGTILADSSWFFQGTRNHHSNSVLNNFGTIINPDNLWNFGTLNNYNNINNIGTTSNCGGIVNNLGTVTGNPIQDKSLSDCPQ